jgi:hypothetical protein
MGLLRAEGGQVQGSFDCGWRLAQDPGFLKRGIFAHNFLRFARETG